MRNEHSISRRLFLAGGVGLAGVSPSVAGAVPDTYTLITPQFEIRMAVEFHDRDRNPRLAFATEPHQRSFCISLKGELSRACRGRFVGALAIARYEIRPRVGRDRITSLRELVKTIDWDTRLQARPPFDRTLRLEAGRASDIQAFGYDADESRSPFAEEDDPRPPWVYFRQDLYIDRSPVCFLTIHWKHTLNAIRMLDVIPGDGTSVLNP